MFCSLTCPLLGFPPKIVRCCRNRRPNPLNVPVDDEPLKQGTLPSLEHRGPPVVEARQVLRPAGMGLSFCRAAKNTWGVARTTRVPFGRPRHFMTLKQLTSTRRQPRHPPWPVGTPRPLRPLRPRREPAAASGSKLADTPGRKKRQTSGDPDDMLASQAPRVRSSGHRDRCQLSVPPDEAVCVSAFDAKKRGV